MCILICVYVLNTKDLAQVCYKVNYSPLQLTFKVNCLLCKALVVFEVTSKKMESRNSQALFFKEFCNRNRPYFGVLILIGGMS